MTRARILVATGLLIGSSLACKSVSNDDSDALVVGGRDIDNTVPAIIFMRNGMASCTGAFITKDWILTSSFCASIGRFEKEDEFKTQRDSVHQLNFPEIPDHRKQFGIGVMRSHKSPGVYLKMSPENDPLVPGAQFKIVGYGCQSSGTKSDDPVRRYGLNKVDRIFASKFVVYSGLAAQGSQTFMDASPCPQDQEGKSLDEGSPLLDDNNNIVGVNLWAKEESGKITTYAVKLSDPAVQKFLQEFIPELRSSPLVKSETVWDALKINDGDRRRSAYGGDYANGVPKAQCADGQRMIGVSRWGNALCTHIHTNMGAPVYSVATGYGPDKSGGGWKPIRTKDDWARGNMKQECPQGYYLAGISAGGDKNFNRRPAEGLCIKANQSAKLGGTCNTVWFDKSDQRPNDPKDEGSRTDFAPGELKGQCRSDQYAAGYSVYYPTVTMGYFTSLLCCNLNP